MSSWQCNHCDLFNNKSADQCIACFNDKPNQSHFVDIDDRIIPSYEMINDDQWIQLVIDGLIRKENKISKISIPKDIYTIILRFHAMKRQFRPWNLTDFQLSPNTLMITPTGASFGEAYMIYPNPNGFNSGIHEWNLKYIGCQISSIRSIGVTSMLIKWVGDRKWPFDDSSYYDGYNFYVEGYDTWIQPIRRAGWTIGETMRVCLNLDLGKVEYFREDKKVKEDKLSKNDGPFYFAICIDSWDKSGIFESV